MKFLHLILLCAFLMLSACTRQEVSPREYPRLATHPVTEITSGGALFNGEITFATSASFTDYGFIWSQKKTPVITNSDTLSLGSSSGTLHFTSRIDHALLEGQTYYVRSYARASDGYLVYGNIESFVSQGTATPYSVIGIENNTDILPYDQINVLGNFGDHVSIKLNGVDMPLILKSSGSLSFKLPPKSPDGGFVEVTIEGQAFPVVKGPRMMLSFVHDLSDQITSYNRQAGIGLGENGYFGFGSNTGNPSYPATTDSVYVYHPATNSLTSIQSNNPLPRASSVVFAIGNLIYFGAPSGASDFYAYNPTSNVFTQLNDMPSSLALKGFTLNEKGYVFFGNGAVNSFYEYNPANDTWTSRALSLIHI